MNDRQDPYAPRDPYAPEQQAQQGYPYDAYDAYGRPVHQEVPRQVSYDQYGQPVSYDTSYEGHGSAAYGTGGPAAYEGRREGHDSRYDADEGRYDGHYGSPAAGSSYDPYGQQHHGATPQHHDPHQGYAYDYDSYGRQEQQSPSSPYPQQYDPYGRPEQPRHTHGQEWIPQQATQPPYEPTSYEPTSYEQQQYPSHDPAQGQGHGQGHSQGQDPSQGQSQGQGHSQDRHEHRDRQQDGEADQRSRSHAYDGPEPSHHRAPADAPASGRASGSAATDRDSSAPDYRTEQFSFIEEPTEDSEDVIDWLKFTESRTERREEAKRRGRSRVIALAVVLAVLLVGGVGYLWWAGKLPFGLSGSGQDAENAGGAQKRDVLVVHLRDGKGGKSATALLVDNETTHKGTTVLLPNDLVVTKDDGTPTTLGKSVTQEGTEPTRESLNTLLGADVKASWRLDTPYLENLVERVGGITLDTDATVPGAKKGDAALVTQGTGQTLNGQAAVAYATYQAKGEPQTKQLLRFGQVMQATLKKVSSDADGATATVKSLLQVLDPPLTEGQLGSSLARRAELAKAGAYRTTVLPVQPDGTLSRQTADSVVKDVLGGTVKNTDPGATARVSVQNASGDKAATGRARVALLNGGYSFVDGGSAAARAGSEVTYADAGHKAKAEEVAKTLGLPTSALKQGKGAANADVTVVLGRDYKG
ncbi:LytR C-terminal domain-containing protein [Streptomyces sp. MST-110588]|uniref:LytR C-terminal domain-containing protein n=1 Tax=Streptomyces sp. MST-110588 TaxID=2833628 RepID=UPI001F5C544B|nr:LytR C-terminal domain-containing protein [Streptomyces sp. MST-110588]UNO42034.1 LytR C-terminal domain-containing protein [Streptomyces sp. MST-110588]